MASLDKFSWGVLLCVALIVGYQAFVPPIVGLADNADYVLVTRWLYMDLANPDPADADRFFRYLVVNFKHTATPLDMQNPWSSEVLLLAPAVLLNWLISKDGLFDIRWAGVTHSLLFLCAVWWMLPLAARLNRRARIVSAAFAILILTDVCYVSYFNSFYSDGAAFLLLLLLIGSASRFFSGYDATRRGLWLVALTSWLFATSKTQHLIVMPLLLAFLWWRRPQVEAVGGRNGFFALFGLLLLSTGVMVKTIPARYKGIPPYNVLFYHILPRAADPEGVLRELGMPADWVRYKGTHAYSDESGYRKPEFRAQWDSIEPTSTLFRHYLRHPSVAYGILREGYRASTIHRPGFGNFQKSAGYAPYAESRAFSLWSGAKHWVFSPGHWWLWFYWLAPGALILWRVRGGLRGAELLLLAMAAVEFTISSLTDVGDMARHLFFFNALLDINFIAAIAVIFHAPRAQVGILQSSFSR